MKKESHSETYKWAETKHTSMRLRQTKGLWLETGVKYGGVKNVLSDLNSPNTSSSIRFK